MTKEETDPQRVDVLFSKLDAFLENMEKVTTRLIDKLETMEEKHE